MGLFVAAWFVRQQFVQLTQSIRYTHLAGLNGAKIERTAMTAARENISKNIDMTVYHWQRDGKDETSPPLDLNLPNAIEGYVAIDSKSGEAFFIGLVATTGPKQ